MTFFTEIKSIKNLSPQVRGCKTEYLVLWPLIVPGFSLSYMRAELNIIMNGINIAKNQNVKGTNPMELKHFNNLEKISL